MLTDGIVEVTDARDQEFGLERAERLLLANAARPLAEIAQTIVGASKMAQLDQAVEALSITLSDEEMRALEAPYEPHAVLGL